jgi:hypothetical protein
MGKTVKKQAAIVADLLDADAVKRCAVEYCLFHYPTLYSAGVPRHENGLWLIPIMLEDPEAGISEQVGELCIDARTRQVSRNTSVEQVVAAGRQLYEGRAHAKAPAGASSRKK